MTLRARLSRLSLVLLVVCLAFAAHPARGQQKDPVLDAWDSQYSNAPLQAQTAAVQKHVTAEIDAYMQAHAGEPAAYRTCALGYNHLAENDLAVQVMRNFVTRFPDDAKNDSLLLFFFSNYGTSHDILSVPAHVRSQTNYWDMTLRVLGRDHASPAQMKLAGSEAVRRVPRDQDKGGDERIKVAEWWLNNSVEPHAAETLAREAVGISEIGPPPDFEIPDTPDAKSKRSILDRLGVRSINRSTLGWALYEEGHYAEARNELQQAAKLAKASSFSTRDVYFRLGQTLEKLGEPKAALVAYDEEFAWGDPGPAVEAAQAAVYRKVHGSLAGLKTDELDNINRLAMQRTGNASALVNDMNQDLGRFTPLDEQGKPLNLAAYKGKVVIVDFWATWCGECLLEMKQTASLQNHYPDQVAVIAPDQDPELTRPKARAYLDKMGYRFELVYDDDTRRQIHLPFIPARLVLDGAGRLRFMELGSTTEGDLLLAQKVAQLLDSSAAPVSSHGGDGSATALMRTRDTVPAELPATSFSSARRP